MERIVAPTDQKTGDVSYNRLLGAGVCVRFLLHVLSSSGYNWLSVVPLDIYGKSSSLKTHTEPYGPVSQSGPHS